MVFVLKHIFPINFFVFKSYLLTRRQKSLNPFCKNLKLLDQILILNMPIFPKPSWSYEFCILLYKKIKKICAGSMVTKSDQFAGPSKVISDQHRFVCRMQIKVIVLWFFGGTVDTEEHIQNIYTQVTTHLSYFIRLHTNIYTVAAAPCCIASFCHAAVAAAASNPIVANLSHHYAVCAMILTMLFCECSVWLSSDYLCTQTVLISQTGHALVTFVVRHNVREPFAGY